MAAESELHFGPFQLHEQTGQLFRDGFPMHMQPKPFALLAHLLRNRHRFVPKEELLAIVWPGVSVSNFALFSALRDLRRVLGDTDSAERMIRTARGRGIRFAARVDVVSRETSRAPDRSPGPAALGRDNERDDALSVLLESLAKACRGELRVSFVSGAAGTGKTHLARELMKRASAEGIEAHVARCIESATLPHLPWRDLAHVLAESVGVAQLALDPRWEACRAFEGLGPLFRRLSAGRPLLLVIDDLHLTDDASLALLEHVLVALDRDPIHLVMSFRDHPRPGRMLARVLAAAARQACTERIELKGLTRAVVARMLNDATGAEAPATAVEQIMLGTSGNALFVSELAKLAARNELDLAALPRKLPVPYRVRDTVRGQLDRLSPAAQRVLHALSATERPLPLAALARVVGASEEFALDALSEAEAAGIAIAADVEARLAFEHELVRESIYGDLAVTARARLHHRIAQALQAPPSTVLSADPEPTYGMLLTRAEASWETVGSIAQLQARSSTYALDIGEGTRRP